jgi:hypothetical protein
MWAAVRGHSDVVQLLLDHPGVDINFTKKVRPKTYNDVYCAALIRSIFSCFLDQYLVILYYNLLCYYCCILIYLAPSLYTGSVRILDTLH